MRETRILKQPWTPPSRRLVLLVLGLICALNLFDASATLVVIPIVGTAEEENPLMRWALDAGPEVFLVIKMGILISFASFLAWQSEHRRLAWIGFCALTCICAALVAFQLSVFIIRPPPGF